MKPGDRDGRRPCPDCGDKSHAPQMLTPEIFGGDAHPEEPCPPGTTLNALFRRSTSRGTRRLRWFCGVAGVLALVLLGGCSGPAIHMNTTLDSLSLDHTTPVDAPLQAAIESIDARLRERHGLTSQQTAVGLWDLRRARLAMINPDLIFYGASVPKIAILLAWFEEHPEAAARLDTQTHHELGLMIKVSDNAMATRFSQELGLQRIQHVVERYSLYDARQGGGLWMGKHYGRSTERWLDPVGGHSHAATVRQLLRYYLLLEQGRLVSPAASQVMREVFASPEIPHDRMKFVKGLAGRPVKIRRKSGSWEDWLHDTAVVTGPERHYILIGLTHHEAGDLYLEGLAGAADDLIGRGSH